MVPFPNLYRSQEPERKAGRAAASVNQSEPKSIHSNLSSDIQMRVLQQFSDITKIWNQPLLLFNTKDVFSSDIVIFISLISGPNLVKS